MAELNFRFLPAAREELRSACRYYERHRLGLGDEFGHEIAQAIRRICGNPTVGSRVAGDKLLRTHRFPYGVVYRAVDDEIVIIAIAHLHRRAGDWNDSEMER